MKKGEDNAQEFTSSGDSRSTRPTKDLLQDVKRISNREPKEYPCREEPSYQSERG